MSDQAIITGSPKAAHKIGSAAIVNPFLQRQTQTQAQPQIHPSSGAMPHYGGGAEKCARCSKSVYLAEKKVGAGRSFHSRCFSCQTCNRKLDATNLSEHKGEIYCKTCYTRQFGVHGLVSGVTMSTEHPTREPRHSRRSSYGSDLDAPVITHQASRQRAHSNDNVLRGETSAVLTDEVPKMFPWRNDVIPERRSPSPTAASAKKSDLELLIEKNRQEKANNPIGFGRVVEPEHRDERQQLDRRESSYAGEQDRQKYIREGEKISYGHGTAAFANVPVVSPPKPPGSHVNRIEIPTLPPTTPSPPSPKPVEPIRRQNSSGTPTDISDNFSRLTLADQIKRQDSNGHITSNIASENPLAKQTYSHSSSYETSRFATTTTTAAASSHSRDSSPSSNNAYNQRTSSSTSGYASSHVISEGNPRHSTTPSPSAFVAQHDYLNTDRSPARNSQVIEHRPSSPRSSERSSSALHDLATKTNHLSGNFSPSNGGKYSTLAALIQPMRPASQTYSDDDDFN